MNTHLYITIVASVLNAILSVLVSCLTTKSDSSLLEMIRSEFTKKRKELIKSTLVTAIVVYFTLMFISSSNKNQIKSLLKHFD
jgi:hypothetical protein